MDLLDCTACLKDSLKEMPPRPLLLTDRIQKLEASVKSLNDELQELRLFCLDLHPEYSKRVIDTMLQIEQKVLFNVTTFEYRLEGINKTVRQLVSQSANDCLALVKDSIATKMSKPMTEPYRCSKPLLPTKYLRRYNSAS